MKFDEIFIPHKKEVRERLIDMYGRDAGEAECSFSSRNYALIFPEGCKPAVIRLNVDGQKTRADVMSELMWVDDLRLSIPTIAQALPSRYNRMAEEFSIGENHYCATMFRKANGDRMAPQDWDAGYFYRVGRLLGQIHKAGHDAGEMGFRYKRRNWYEMPLWDFESCPHMSAAMKARCGEIYEKMRRVGEEPGCYGMIHGDFQQTNLYSDWDDVWVFDFDDCCYGHYIYDFASFLYLVLVELRYHPEGGRREVIWGKDGVLEHMRAGYEEYYHLPEDQWALLDDWLRLYIASAMGILCRNKAKDVKQILYILDSQGPLLAEGDLKENVELWFEKLMQTVSAFSVEQLFSVKGRMSEKQMAGNGDGGERQ